MGSQPAYGGRGPKPSGLLDIDGQHTPLVSGREGPTQQIPPPRTGTGMNGKLVTHVEAHAAAQLRVTGATNGTLYINRLPCSDPQPPYGCSEMLPRMVPRGSTLTIYGPDGFVRVVRGEG